VLTASSYNSSTRLANVPGGEKETLKKDSLLLNCSNTSVAQNLMGSLLKFNKYYFVLAVLLLAVEILIALFAHDRIIRPYVGDILVVMLIYCTVRSFLDTPVLPTALLVLAFSFAIEGLQYVNILHTLGLQQSTMAATILGNSFAWMDVLAYIVGIILVLLFEKIMLIRNVKGTANLS
jgi:Protein of unknown function (DUF2809)